MSGNDCRFGGIRVRLPTLPRFHQQQLPTRVQDQKLTIILNQPRPEPRWAGGNPGGLVVAVLFQKAAAEPGAAPDRRGMWAFWNV